MNHEYLSWITSSVF